MFTLASMVVQNVATLQLQDPWFDPVHALRSVWSLTCSSLVQIGSLQALWFPPTSQKLASR